MSRNRRSSLSFSNLATFVLFSALFLVGMPLDGQLGQFSGGTLVPSSTDYSVQRVGGSRTVVALVWGGLYLVAFWVLARKKQNLIVIIKAVPFYVLYLAYIGLSTLWSDQTTLGLFDIAQLTGSAVIGAVIALRYRNAPDHFVIHVALALGAAQLLSTILIVLAPSLGVAPNGRWVGMYSSPNYLGSLGFCSLWANIAVIAILKPRRVWLFMLFAFVSIANLYGTNSITSIVSAMVALGLSWFWPQIVGNQRGPSVNLFLVIIPGLVIFLAYAMGLVRLLTESLFSISGRSADLTGRADIWSEAFSAIVEKPIFGHGFGSELAFISVARLTDFHSSYIDTLFSGGLLAFTLLLLCFYQAIRNSLLLGMHDVKTARILGSMLVATFTYNLTETALLDPRAPIFIIFVSIIVLVRVVKRPHSNICTSYVAEKWKR